MLLLLVLLYIAAAGAAAVKPSYCDALTLPPCMREVARDMMFLVDASMSMDENRFYTQLLDYTLSLYCTFTEDLPNQVGMILFNREVKVVIPLDTYSRIQWHAQVERIRKTRYTDNPACCSCCTPHAEAFLLANQVFDEHAKNTAQIAFVITDGVPSPNGAGSTVGGNPSWWYYTPTIGLSPAKYNLEVVPMAAKLLKDNGRRIVLVGVPDSFGKPPNVGYFTGQLPNDSNYCVTRDNIQFCERVNASVFPIVSEPADKNAFTSDGSDASLELVGIVDAICEVIPPILDQVDLTFVVDRSKSMTYQPKLCKQILNSFPRDDDGDVNFNYASSNPCWDLWTMYMLKQAKDLSKMRVGADRTRELGWDNSFPNTSVPAKGLRVNIIGFGCTNKQRTPLMYRYTDEMNGGPVTSLEVLQKLLLKLRKTVSPDGGSCPHLAIEQAVKTIESTDPKLFPLQSVILLTDGVFYDGTATPRATAGLHAYKALTYAVGISIAKSDNKFGMTKKDIATQTTQLSSFVNGDNSKFYNLQDGWSALLNITEKIAASLPDYYYGGTDGVMPIDRYTWCGYRRKINCVTDPNRNATCEWTGTTPTAQYACQPKIIY